ncbi:MAG TPA: hypothetical protein VK717_12830 [Opitutaceae bacterium]|jgi:hypothetical protein|nr:hypothetical protein [Opitutaceae bacterium]
MKRFKLITAGSLALAFASMASAQTFVKLTGSTAYRKATYDAIVKSLNTPKGAAIGGTTADFTGDAQAVITGTLKSGPSAGQAVVIQTAFGGSVGGLNVLTHGLTTIPGTSFDSLHTWISSTTNTLTPLTVNGDGTISGATILTSANFEGASTADTSMSDSFQSSSPFPTPSLLEENPAGNGVGVVQFFWVKGLQSPDVPAGSYNALTNISPLQAQLLLAAGELPLSLFTGVASDSSVDVILLGRNNDSGTRLDAEAEPGYGFGQLENQYQTVGSPITSLVNVGDNGYASGGTLATALKTSITAGTVDDAGNPFILVGYLGKSDKNTAVAGGGVALKYAGFDGTVDTNIENGQYTFWAYEHAYYKSGLGTVKQNAINLYSNELRVTDAVQSGILLTAMGVSRSIEGGPVSP